MNLLRVGQKTGWDVQVSFKLLKFLLKQQEPQKSKERVGRSLQGVEIFMPALTSHAPLWFFQFFQVVWRRVSWWIIVGISIYKFPRNSQLHLISPPLLIFPPLWINRKEKDSTISNFQFRIAITLAIDVISLDTIIIEFHMKKMCLITMIKNGLTGMIKKRLNLTRFSSSFCQNLPFPRNFWNFWAGQKQCSKLDYSSSIQTIICHSIHTI